MSKGYRYGLWLLATITAWQLGQAGYIHAKALLAQVLMTSAWERTLAGEAQARPWPWADTWPVARLQVPRLGIDQIVLHGATGSSLAVGPGHLDGSASPGAPGNSILSGHRDTHFAFLQDLQPGDTLTITDHTGERREFRMQGSKVFDSTQQRLSGGDDTPRLLLLTCYPFDALTSGGPLRYLAELDVAQRHTPSSF